VLVVVGGACASNPDRLYPRYVEPERYDAYDCDELASEIVRLGYQNMDLHERLERRRVRDQWQAGFAWFYGITAFFIDGDGVEADRYQQLQGEFEAARTQSKRKGCGLDAAFQDQVIRNAIERLESTAPP
jgi:hypothetical protein